MAKLRSGPTHSHSRPAFSPTKPGTPNSIRNLQVRGCEEEKENFQVLLYTLGYCLNFLFKIKACTCLVIRQSAKKLFILLSRLNNAHTNMSFWASLASDDSQPTPGVPDNVRGWSTGDPGRAETLCFSFCWAPVLGIGSLRLSLPEAWSLERKADTGDPH